MTHVELSPELKEWVLANPNFIMIVLDYLRRHPAEFWDVVGWAQCEGVPEGGLDLYAPGGLGEQRWYAEQATAKELLSTGQLLNCAECFVPCLYFGDGQKVGWPEMATHECNKEKE